MLPLTVGIRDGVVHLVSTLGSAVISTRAELGSIIASALPVATVSTRHRVCVCDGACVCVWPNRVRAGVVRFSARYNKLFMAKAAAQLHVALAKVAEADGVSAEWLPTVCRLATEAAGLVRTKRSVGSTASSKPMFTRCFCPPKIPSHTEALPPHPPRALSAHAEMTALPKVDTNCTAPSLVPIVNGNKVRSFSTHGQLSAAKGSSTNHCLTL